MNVAKFRIVWLRETTVENFVSAWKNLRDRLGRIVAHPPRYPTRREQGSQLLHQALLLKLPPGIAPILDQDVENRPVPLMEWRTRRAASRRSAPSFHLRVCLVSLRKAALLPPLVASTLVILAPCCYDQRPGPQKTHIRSGKTNHSFSTLSLRLTARASHTLQTFLSTLLPVVSLLLQYLHRQLISSYKHSNTNSTYPPNVRQATHIEIPDQAEFPTLSPTYSSDPTINPNPLHLNPPMPRDEFYLALNCSKLFNATMTIGKILNVNRIEMLQDGTPSPFVRESTEEPLLKLPDNPPDLQPTKVQREIQHLPYTDAPPFEGFRDTLLGHVQKGEETVNYVGEVNICNEIYESLGVCGECPWEGRSWEIGEALAREREDWFLMDGETIRSTNCWRRRRGLEPLPTREEYWEEPGK